MAKNKSRKSFSLASGNLVETSHMLKSIKKRGFANIKVVHDDSAKYPSMTYKIVDKKNKVLVKGVMLDQINIFKSKKSERGKAMHILREVEARRRRSKRVKRIAQDFESKKSVFKANLKIPEVFRLEKSRNRIKILIPNSIGVVNRKYFDLSLNHAELKEFNSRRSELSKMRYLQKLSQDIEVKQKTAFRRGAKYTYTHSKKRIKAGDSVAAVMTYELDKEFIKKHNRKHGSKKFKHWIGRMQSGEYDNTLKGRRQAKADAFDSLEMMLLNYGVSDSAAAIKGFSWTFRYQQLGNWSGGKRL